MEKTLQVFEGHVLEILEGSFLVRLYDLTDPSRPEELAEILTDHLPPEEQALVGLGAAFRWEIVQVGHEDDAVSRFRFSRDVFTQADIDAAKEKAKQWAWMLEVPEES